MCSSTWAITLVPKMGYSKCFCDIGGQTLGFIQMKKVLFCWAIYPLTSVSHFSPQTSLSANYRTLFVCLFVLSGGKPSSTQGTFLAQHWGITPWGAWGTMWDARNQIGSHVQGKHLTHCTIAPGLNHGTFIHKNDLCMIFFPKKNCGHLSDSIYLFNLYFPIYLHIM